jgi:hypothetical protein
LWIAVSCLACISKMNRTVDAMSMAITLLPTLARVNGEDRQGCPLGTSQTPNDGGAGSADRRFCDPRFFSGVRPTPAGKSRGPQRPWFALPAHEFPTRVVC